MPLLTSTRAALTLITANDRHAWFQLEDGYVVRIAADVWDDMGRPDTLTVTVEPGDALNGATP